jgi:hypothetical protein
MKMPTDYQAHMVLHALLILDKADIEKVHVRLGNPTSMYYVDVNPIASNLQFTMEGNSNLKWQKQNVRCKRYQNSEHLKHIITYRKKQIYEPQTLRTGHFKHRCDGLVSRRITAHETCEFSILLGIQIETSAQQGEKTDHRSRSTQASAGSRPTATRLPKKVIARSATKSNEIIQNTKLRCGKQTGL